MASVDRWPPEMQMIQESLVWLVPDAVMARTLVSEAGIPEGFIDFGEPVWNRIKRIMVEAEKREMMPQLLDVITSWYPENSALNEAKVAWEAGEDRKAAAALLRKAAKAITEPVAVAKITRKDDDVRRVEVDVKIPELTKSAPGSPVVTESVTGVIEPVVGDSGTEPVEVAYSDHVEPGDWFSFQKTLVDQEQRLRELETWRQQLSIFPTIARKSEGES